MKVYKYSEYNMSESVSDKIKIGLDFHGVIDALPKFFSFLTEAVIKNGGEIHIITGNSLTDEFIDSLKSMGIHWTHLFSILDYHREMKTPTRENHPTYGFPMINDDDWDKTKGEYCKNNNISFHIDDTTVYNEYFTTPFARLWTHNNNPKKSHKDPRHLD